MYPKVSQRHFVDMVSSMPVTMALHTLSSKVVKTLFPLQSSTDCLPLPQVAESRRRLPDQDFGYLENDDELHRN